MTKFAVPDMTCGHCKAAIETALKEIDAGADIKVDLEAHTVTVASKASEDAMLAAIKEAGYSPAPLQ